MCMVWGSAVSKTCASFKSFLHDVCLQSMAWLSTYNTILPEKSMPAVYRTRIPSARFVLVTVVMLYSIWATEKVHRSF